MMQLGLAIAAVIIGLDQLTKWLVLERLDLATGPIVVTPFWNLVLVWNRGISFGLFDSGSPMAPWILAGLALAIVAGLLIWLRHVDLRPTALGIGLVIGGALGNVVDRIRFGAVVDFLDFHLAGYHWPAFNVADAAICIGAVLLLADGLLSPQRQHT